MNYDDYLYQDRTWFDQIAERLMRCFMQCLPRHQGRLWTGGFALFASLCVAWAAGLASHAVLAELSRNQAVAQLLAALLLLAAARHFLAVTGLSAADAQPRHKLIRRSVPRRPEAVGLVASAVETHAVPPVPPSIPPPTHDDAQQFFREVRAAGVNVRIARALYAAGFRNAEQVRAADDRHLLAMPGIGAATLRKLRVKFGLPRIAA